MVDYVDFMLNNFVCVCSPPYKSWTDHGEPVLEVTFHGCLQPEVNSQNALQAPTCCRDIWSPTK